MQTQQTLKQIALLSLLVALPQPLSAQLDTMDVRFGERLLVELNAPQQQVGGAFFGQLEDTLYVTQGGGARRSIPLAQIEAIDRRRVNRFSGALAGGAIGALVPGVVLFLVSVQSCTMCDPGESFLLGTGYLGPYGAIAGAALGAVIGSRNWARVYQRE
jgi:hypothetical protein